MITQHDIHITLESTFTMIQQTRMDDVPVINDKLSVKAIGFHEWNRNQLGILITPWFMNVMLFPHADETSKQQGAEQGAENLEPRKVGSTQLHVFPSGAYDFVVGYEDEIGYFQSCSLFSPMFEFEDQDAAELTAKEALAAMMNEENIDFSSQSRDHEIAQIWNGEKAAPAMTEGFSTEAALDSPSGQAVNNAKPKKLLSDRIKERIDEPTSRRDFLRGKIFSSDELS